MISLSVIRPGNPDLLLIANTTSPSSPEISPGILLHLSGDPQQLLLGSSLHAKEKAEEKLDSAEKKLDPFPSTNFHLLILSIFFC